MDPELLDKLIDMEKIDANSVDDCTDEGAMEFLGSTQERIRLSRPSLSRPKWRRKCRLYVGEGSGVARYEGSGSLTLLAQEPEARLLWRG
jgi:hypothetical protein